MSDETPKPLMPKRPTTFKAAEAQVEVKPPTTRKVSKKKLEDVRYQSTLLPLRDKACVMLAIEKGVEFAAEHMKMDVAEVERILDSEPVRFLLQEQQAMDMMALAKKRAKEMEKVGITRTAIEQRLFELMNLDPDQTKGNIDGQVKAATALADKFGYAGEKDPLAGKTPEELAAIVREGHDLLAKGATSVN